MNSSTYSHIPTEENDNFLEVVAPIERRHKRSPKILIVSACALVLVILGLVVDLSRHGKSKSTGRPKIAFEFGGIGSQQNARAATGDPYLLGVGKADITGPVVEIDFLGYASLAQTGTGLRQRIYSRAFIIGSVSNPDERFIYVVADIAFGDTGIRYGVLDALANLGDDYSMYSQQNLALTGTHSHSGPGAWANYLVVQVTSLGFDKQSYQAVVDGITLSIKRAHESMEPGYLSFGTTNITDANINRSLYAYLNNPAEERAMYDTTVETDLTMLRFQRASDSKYTGVLTWFPVHGTSMLENNTHVTGDNKGVASYLFEKAAINDDTAADGFVAGFSQANVGDTTPNVLGAFCDDGSGEMCTFENSTCGGSSAACHGRGPEFQKLDLRVSSCYEIGRRQYEGAKDLFDNFDQRSTPVTDSSVKYFHFFQNMEGFTFPLANGTMVKTCAGALGYSFAAGTTDGPGVADFTQNDPGSPDANPQWQVATAFLREPSAAQIACQYPKPILLDVGEMTLPYAWDPNIVDIQVLRVGQFMMIISPSEATTMAGRRWKSAIKTAAIDMALTTQEPMVVIGGPANTYAHYCTTEEEFAIQRYEGASTLYGQHELNAYINLTISNLKYLAADSTTLPLTGTLPPNNVNSSLSFITGVVFDGTLSKFGNVIYQPNISYAAGDVINATFVGANPRNNLRLEETFTAIEMYSGGKWTRVRDDFDWSLVYTWVNTNNALGFSEVTISWESEADVAPGTYRTHYYGDAKNIFGTITAFEGVSNNYTVA